MPEICQTGAPEALAGSVADLPNDFPADFIWGLATSAYQIEGATELDGRGPCIWDTFASKPGAIADGSSGAVACEHYQRLDSDLDLLQACGARAYRFSIAWPRVQPDGKGAWNEAGWAFYQRLLDGLAKRGIQAHLTLYHWDLPQALQDEGGWAARSTAQYFAAYAAQAGRRFGAQVASIATLNEPWVVATLGHESGIFAPGIKDRAIAMQVAHNLLLAHGLALQALRAQGGPALLGIVLNQAPVQPASDTLADRAKAQLEDGLLVRWYMDALFKGAYPADVLEHLGQDAPHTEAGDMALISAPLDFLGLNYYTRNLVSAQQAGAPDSSGSRRAAQYEVTDMGWEVYPQGLHTLLLRLARDWDTPPLYVTENGAAYADVLQQGRVHDVERCRYLQMHIGAMRQAMQDGADVRAYFAWSWMDNFEWAFGYSKRFGLVYVDYASQQRYLKDSAYWYRDWIMAQHQAALAA
ncbi:GH1 family beta-glucosidase [Massilia sp. W12]|uniref:GH1 family beta-glucosidase n=1 Tax=Massilia sp. W12 TaxID=3126507 RepID=UPI0030D3F821